MQNTTENNHNDQIINEILDLITSKEFKGYLDDLFLGWLESSQQEVIDGSERSNLAYLYLELTRLIKTIEQ
jgi:hypothetical protein